MLSVLLAITLLTSGVLAQNPPGFTSQSGPPSFLGCYAAHTPESIVQPGLFGILACSSTCKNQGVRWFFWNPDTQGCACAPTTWGTPNFLLTGSNTVGCTSTNQVPPGCQSCPFNTWQYWDSETSFVSGYSTCYAQPNVNIALGSYNIIGVPNDCYTQCAKSTYAYVYANIAFNQWNCFCSDSYLVPGGTSFQGCQQGSVFVFAHSLQAQASGLSRRSRVLANPNKYCPGALQACKVADSSEGYECIDTRSELESCGGCVNGYFDNSTQHLGVNCDALSTHSQQYTCVAGLCQPL